MSAGIASGDVFVPLSQVLNQLNWPLAGLVPGWLDCISTGSPSHDDTSNQVTIPFILTNAVNLTIPGIDDVTFVIGSGASAAPGSSVTPSDLIVDFTKLSIAVNVPVTVNVNSDLLTPVDQNNNPTGSPLSIGPVSVGISFDATGEVSFTFPSSMALQRCLVGDTGVIVSAQALGWCIPSTSGQQTGSTNLPPNFSGFYATNTFLSVPSLGVTATLDYLFIGTGGVTCSITVSQTATFNGSSSNAGAGGSLPFTVVPSSAGGQTVAPVTLFQGGPSGGSGSTSGFAAAFEMFKVVITQSTFTDLTIAGYVSFPFFDDTILLGLSVGLDSSGAILVAATSPTSFKCAITPGASVVKPSAPIGSHLLQFAGLFGGNLTIDVDSVAFIIQPGQPAVIDIAGDIQITNSLLTQAGYAPTFGLKGLRIDTSGNIAIDGGWLSLPNVVPANIDSIFPFSISKIGLGKDASGNGWVGVNGGIKLTDSLPIGISVSGLRFYQDGNVSLEGIGLTLSVPGAFDLSGSAAYFHDTSGQNGSGFRGKLDLTLTALNLKVDASLAVGQVSGTAYAFLVVDVELPIGIPVFATGFAFFGFAGLLAVDMAPNRQPDQDWYTGWYLGSPAGVTDFSKWVPQAGAFAIGFGATLGTLPDLGFTGSAKVILVVAIPGPQIIFAGKANFLLPRPGLKPPDAQGTFTALIVYDGVNDVFQADLAANYSVPVLVDIGGGAEIAGAWGPGYDTTKYWHFYLGQKTPASAELHAHILNLFDANAYLMINRDRFQIGADITFGPKFDFGPVKAWLTAEIRGSGDVSFNPAHFDGNLMLAGSAGLTAFGVGITIAVNASFEAQGPKPWDVKVDVNAEIKISLIFTSLDFKADLGFSWSNQDQPSPVDPLLSSGDSKTIVQGPATGLCCTHPHPLSTDSIGLTTGNPAVPATVPPDGVITLTFARPTNDLIGIGQAAISARADTIGHNTFSYGLAGVALTDSSGQLVAARALGAVSGTTLTPVGALGLPQTVSCVVTIGQSSQNGSISAAGVITLTTPPGDGTQVFSVAVAPATEQVTISSITAGQANTNLTLQAPPNAGWSVYAGGSLSIGQSTWTIVGGSGTTLIIQTGSVAPSIGTANITAPPPPNLTGVWGSDTAYDPGSANPTSMTKLYLWADCPFVYFAYNASQSGPAKPTYTCGPAPTESLTCIDFNSRPIGDHSNFFSIGGVDFFEDGYRIVQVDSPGDRALRLQGNLRASFSSNEDIVEIDIGLLAGGSVSITGYYGGKPTGPVQTLTAPAGSLPTGAGWPKPVLRKKVLLRAVDAVWFYGWDVLVYSLCFQPTWTEITFSSVFSQASTGSTTYDGLSFSSAGVMSVVGLDQSGQNGTLNVGTTLVDAGSGVLTHRQLGVGYHQRLQIASIEIIFPQPITRVSIGLGAAAWLSVYAGKTLLGSQAGQAGSTISFRSGQNHGSAHPGWFDRIVLSRPFGPVQIDTISYDGGPFGWERYQQWQWQTSLQQSVSSLYQTQPVLPPGTYTISVVTQTTSNIPVANPTPSYQASFTVGQPPMQPSDAPSPDPTQGRYPTGGALCRLATYVEEPLPDAGQRPFYRRLDTAVGFKTNYVSALYLQAGTPLELLVIDANGTAQRAGQQNVWGNAPQPLLTGYQTAFVQTLQGSTTNPCATVDLSQVVTPEVLSSAGTILPPSSLLRNELQANGTNLYRSDFSTSKYGNLRHHLATASGACRQLGATNALVAAATAAASDVQTYANSLTSAISNYNAATAGNDLTAIQNAGASLTSALSALSAAQAADFQQIEAALPAPLASSLPSGVALTRFDSPGAGVTVFLIEADEPLPWDRTSITVVGAASAVRRTKMPIDASFGSPAAGQTVELPAASVTSSVELLLVQSSLNPSYATSRVPGANTSIQVASPQAAAISATVIVNNGGTVSLQSNPPAASDPPPQGPTTDTTGNPFANATSLSMNAPVTNPVSIKGTDFGLIELDVNAAYVPIPPNGSVRVNAVRLPANSTDTDYAIDLTFLDTQDISNWTVVWWDLSAPADTPTILGVVPSGTQFSEAAQIRWYPSLRSAPADTDVDQIILGGAGTPPPPSGAVLQLLNQAGALVHEWGAMPLQLSQAVVAVPSSDGTRAFLVVPQVPMGSVTLAFSLNLAATGMPTWSIGGQSPPETAHLLATSSPPS